MTQREPFFQKLAQTLPPVFTREEAARHLGGLFRAKTLRNIDVRGEGPSLRVKIGKKVAYERDSFLDWLRHYKAA